jgi:regulator of sigma E protease
MQVMRVLNALVVPKSEGERAAVARNVGGPVMILTMLYDSVRSGFIDAIGFLRMICINLAILNLLPIPVLDGGHVCVAMYEVITRRKPHPKVVAGLVNVFAFILIGLMVFLMFRDVIVRRKLNNLNKTIEIREVEK